MAYYTEVDTTDTLIMNLAGQLTTGRETPYDKVQSVLDYFLGRDENGDPRFTYTLEPGSPKDLSQSFMHYFLSKTKRDIAPILPAQPPCCCGRRAFPAGWW
jgi:hypothetical protein